MENPAVTRENLESIQGVPREVLCLGSAFSAGPPEATVTHVASAPACTWGRCRLTKVRLLLRGRARGRYPVSLAVE